VIDANTEHFIFEITGRVSKIEQFIAIMKPLGLVEICRTGIAAMNRGPQGMCTRLAGAADRSAGRHMQEQDG
jgi:acetolactate synthase-1/3 small subunit